MLLLFGDTHTYLYDYFTYALVMFQIHVGWVYSSLGSWQKSVRFSKIKSCMFMKTHVIFLATLCNFWVTGPGFESRSVKISSIQCCCCMVNIYSCLYPSKTTMNFDINSIQELLIYFLKVILWHRHNGSFWSIYFQVSKPYYEYNSETAITQRISLWEANSHSLHFKRLVQRHWVTGKFSRVMNPK